MRKELPEAKNYRTDNLPDDDHDAMKASARRYLLKTGPDKELFKTFRSVQAAQ
jgi:hypothetical protein